ncbi:MAG: hypothetical protein JWN56_731 [Sphingobacteriales bacterium]|nr:hypothetical protein [Sphingobacteriales bacterium]
MKVFLILLVMMSTICSCNNNHSSNKVASEKLNIDLQYDTLCFQKVSGISHQDTATIQLLINGESVTGRFSNVPSEKDARIGTLTGTKKDDVINGVWAYNQEGMAGSLPVVFKLSGNTLNQKDFQIDNKTGREIITDSSKFSIVFDKIKCLN